MVRERELRKEEVVGWTRLMKSLIEANKTLKAKLVEQEARARERTTIDWEKVVEVEDDGRDDDWEQDFELQSRTVERDGDREEERDPGTGNLGELGGYWTAGGNNHQNSTARAVLAAIAAIEDIGGASRGHGQDRTTPPRLPPSVVEQLKGLDLLPALTTFLRLLRRLQMRLRVMLLSLFYLLKTGARRQTNLSMPCASRSIMRRLITLISLSERRRPWLNRLNNRKTT